MAAHTPRALAIAVAGLLALGGCSAYDDGYGYGGVSLGYGSGYYDPWYYDRYGWYDGFYYPGSGYYVYDRHGKRHRWNNHHRGYWESRRHGRGDGGHRWRDRDQDHDRDGGTRREWRRDRDNDSGYWRGRGQQDGDRQRENWSGRSRSRPDADFTRPSRGERSPALRGLGDRERPAREWRRRD